MAEQRQLPKFGSFALAGPSLEWLSRCPERQSPGVSGALRYPSLGGERLALQGGLAGGEGGIRTLDGLLTHTPLAGERFQPLSHLSMISIRSIRRDTLPD